MSGKKATDYTEHFSGKKKKKLEEWLLGFAAKKAKKQFRVDRRTVAHSLICE